MWRLPSRLALDETGLDPKRWTANAAIAREKAAEAASLPTSSKRWSKARCEVREGKRASVAAVRHRQQDPISLTLLPQLQRKLASDIKLVDYVRFQLGEGIEKEVSRLRSRSGGGSSAHNKGRPRLRGDKALAMARPLIGCAPFFASAA
jgi:hypothetical protein